jgi:3-carboxy-cis,cis-muconate cycloisomerase
VSGSTSTRLLDPLFTTDRMRAVFSDRGRLQGMLEFEAALARAEARAGIVPAAVVAPIESQCRAELFDVDDLARGAALGGNTAIPMVKALTALVAKQDATAARYVHWGATSQDAMDTGLVLQLRDALDSLDADLARLSLVLAGLAERHKRTVLAGRTWLQQATPVTFGLKAAGALSAVERHRARMRELRPRVLVLQFGGASGTLAALGADGLKVAAALADELELALPDLPWHSQRDRVAEVATALGLLVGTLGKVARDIALLMQTEVGEAFEPAAGGKGGSSTMPHKRNPVACAAILAAAVRVPGLVSTMLAAMVQEHERGLGDWHAEWDTLPEIVCLAAGALAQLVQVLDGLELDPVRMGENLAATRGLILAEAVTMALGDRIGRLPAHHLVEAACRRAAGERRHLRDVLGEDPEVRKHLSAEDLDRLLDPANYVGLAETLVERALAARTG